MVEIVREAEVKRAGRIEKKGQRKLDFDLEDLSSLGYELLNKEARRRNRASSSEERIG